MNLKTMVMVVALMAVSLGALSTGAQIVRGMNAAREVMAEAPADAARAFFAAR